MPPTHPFTLASPAPDHPLREAAVPRPIARNLSGGRASVARSIGHIRHSSSLMTNSGGVCAGWMSGWQNPCGCIRAQA
eukprot:2031319-Prorocentrum_lima.AAC.1